MAATPGANPWHRPETALEAVALLGANVSFVLQGIGREIGAIAAQSVALATLDIKGFKAISTAVKEDGERAHEDLPRLNSILGFKDAFLCWSATSNRV